MRTLYADIHPYHQHQLQVSDLHTLYVEECGDPNGIPILFLHGGPGAGANEYCRRFFDPERYRIIVFDQRGCGRSTPYGSIEGNNADELVADIEAIRQHLNIDSWVLFGGSWGSTLALLYGQAFPDKVRGMILRGIFLSREQDYQWLYGGQAGRVFPDEWQKFLNLLTPEQRQDPVATYYEMLNGENELKRMAAAKAWGAWEGQIATLKPNPKLIQQFVEPHSAMARSRIECHFIQHRCFVEPGQILNNMESIKDIPAILIHGRYDMVCTLDNATELFHQWPAAELHIVREAGHSAFEKPNIDALVKATDSMAEQLGEPEADA